MAKNNIKKADSNSWKPIIYKILIDFFWSRLYKSKLKKMWTITWDDDESIHAEH